MVGDVWYAIPSINVARCAESFEAWHKMGYKCAVLVDKGKPACAQADHVIEVEQYGGYYQAVNRLARELVEKHNAAIVVTGGDDMFPDPKKTATEIAVEFFARFPDGFGIMQPTGDPMPGTDRICGSPWMGREWIRRAYSGRGPMWPGYVGFFGDEELKNVAEALGVLWQRPDLAQRHDHYTRKGGPAKLDYQAANEKKCWAPDMATFTRRRSDGFPHHVPLARFKPDGIVVVTGGGGFIGHHLVKRLVREGCDVRAVDLHVPEFENSPAQEFILADMRDQREAERAMFGASHVFALAADMGGIGFIETNRGRIVQNNTRITLTTLDAAVTNRVKRLFFSSSACVYPAHRQTSPLLEPLREFHAWPADPEDGYGHEKLYAEVLCRLYREDLGLETRVARYHNIFGPLGTWRGGREKAPAAICRKVADAIARAAKTVNAPKVEVWGDGMQSRSFCYVDDCVEGTIRLMASEHVEPLNIGSDELVTVNQLVDLVAEIAGQAVEKMYKPDAPKGVRGRNAELTECFRALGWKPAWKLREGLAELFPWVAEQCERIPF
jgi:GDP-D-mannose 3',5'-epimerase